MLKIENLKAGRSDKSIIKGLSLEVKSGEVHALMGPNGSGKSTLSLALMGHPEVEISDGKIELDGENVIEMEPDEKAIAGLFLAFQYPVEIPGVSYLDFLRMIYTNSQKKKSGEDFRISPIKFRKLVEEKLKILKLNTDFLGRNLNEGFSGGEKKKSEILQMMLLSPKYAILDETDSGLDITALKIVAEGARKFAEENNTGLLIITHYKRMLEYLKPTHIHILIDGKIAKSGGMELSEQLEEHGYDIFQKN